MEDFEKKVTLEIDKDRLGVFVAAFGAAAPECLLGRTNVNEARPIFLRAQSLNREYEVSRNAGVTTGAQLFVRDCPGAALDNHFAATQARHVRRHSKLKRVKAEWDYPGAGK